MGRIKITRVINKEERRIPSDAAESTFLAINCPLQISAAASTKRNFFYKLYKRYYIGMQMVLYRGVVDVRGTVGDLV